MYVNTGLLDVFELLFFKGLKIILLYLLRIVFEKQITKMFSKILGIKKQLNNHNELF
jgi:hypothetical protein